MTPGTPVLGLGPPLALSLGHAHQSALLTVFG